MQSPFYPGCWPFVTSGSEKKLFCRWFGALPGWPCQLFWAEQRNDGKGAEWMRLDSQVEEGKYLAMPPPPPRWGMPLSHRIRPCLHLAPCATSHSVFRVTDLISWIIFQAGHRWGIQLKTWLGVGHKRWILGASRQDDMKRKWIL